MLFWFLYFYLIFDGDSNKSLALNLNYVIWNI